MKHLCSIFSAPIKICCLCICLASCASHTVDRAAEARSALALQAAVDHYGIVDSPDARAYAQYLTSRLSSALEKINRRCNECDLTILNTREPLAYSPGPKHIVISKGMLTRLASEVELAFVLSHEMAHQVLDHHAEINAAGPAPLPEFREDLEKEADKFAVGLLAVAGYDPRFAPNALLDAYGMSTSSGQMAGYPELSVRIKLVQDEVEASNWQPPGTVDRRDFQKLRRELAMQAPQS